MRFIPLLLLALPAVAAADMHYSVQPDLAAKSIRVGIRIDDAKEQEELRIPAWCPGFYFILDYEKKISDFKATDASGKVLKVTKKDARGWVVSNPGKGTISVSYRVLGDDGGLGFFGTSVKPHTAFINGPSAFMYADGRKEEKVHLNLNLPKDWKVATGMTSDGDARYTAGGYDEFIDHPMQLGIFDVRTFVVGGIPYEAAFVGLTPNTARADLDAETERLRKLTIPAVQLFGSAPFKKYVYIIHLASGNFGGGLEHRASTVLNIENTKPLDIDTLATHEFFHTWNVKHIRPKVLGPFDYTQPVRTNNLWFAEGVTDYYANIVAYRSGLMSQDELLGSLGSEIASLQRGTTRKQKTLAQVSWNAWETGGFGDGDLNYYTKGLVAGLIFDAAIRAATDGEKSLDDVFRLMYSRYKLPAAGYEEDGILKTFNEVSGTDMSALYKTVVQSTDEVPYDVLMGIGLKLDHSLPCDVLVLCERSPYSSFGSPWFAQPCRNRFDLVTVFASRVRKRSN